MSRPLNSKDINWNLYDEFIINNVNRLTTNEIAEELNLNLGTLSHHIRKVIKENNLQVTRRRSSKFNYKVIDVYVKENFENKTVREMAEYLNIHPLVLSEIIERRLGLKKQIHHIWTPFELRLLKDNYPKRGAKYCSKILNLPIFTVQKMANSRGIKRKHKYRSISSQGYYVITIDGKRMAEHRYIMEQKLGRKLTSKELVHHKDEDKLNNDPSNLELTTRPLHIKKHLHSL